MLCTNAALHNITFTTFHINASIIIEPYSVCKALYVVDLCTHSYTSSSSESKSADLADVGCKSGYPVLQRCSTQHNSLLGYLGLYWTMDNWQGIHLTLMLATSCTYHGKLYKLTYSVGHARPDPIS